MKPTLQVPESSTMHIYKQMKNYSYPQFVEFCKNLYQEGFEDGKISVPGADINVVLQAISEIKGIGPKLLNDIQNKLDSIIDES